MFAICLAVTGEASNCCMVKMISPGISTGGLMVGTGKQFNASTLLCLDPSWYCRSYWYAANFNV